MAQFAGWKVDLDVAGTNNSFHVTVRIPMPLPKVEAHMYGFA